jgi:hypothetical protein
MGILAELFVNALERDDLSSSDKLCQNPTLSPRNPLAPHLAANPLSQALSDRNNSDGLPAHRRRRASSIWNHPKPPRSRIRPSRICSPRRSHASAT